MWNELLKTDLPVLNLCVRAFVIYFVVLLLLRISGKRQLGQMGATEFVAILLISNAVQNAMNGGDNSLPGGVILAVILVASSTLISVLTYRSSFFRQFFEGTPTLLVHHGKLLRKNLARERLNQSDLRILLRKQGIHDITSVDNAVLESDGTLSVTKKEESPWPEE